MTPFSAIGLGLGTIEHDLADFVANEVATNICETLKGGGKSPWSTLHKAIEAHKDTARELWAARSSRPIPWQRISRTAKRNLELCWGQYR